MRLYVLSWGQYRQLTVQESKAVAAVLASKRNGRMHPRVRCIHTHVCVLTKYTNGDESVRCEQRGVRAPPPTGRVNVSAWQRQQRCSPHETRNQQRFFTAPLSARGTRQAQKLIQTANHQQRTLPAPLNPRDRRAHTRRSRARGARLPPIIHAAAARGGASKRAAAAPCGPRCRPVLDWRHRWHAPRQR
jgi:hypothetical protein